MNSKYIEDLNQESTQEKLHRGAQNEPPLPGHAAAAHQGTDKNTSFYTDEMNAKYDHQNNMKEENCESNMRYKQEVNK